MKKYTDSLDLQHIVLKVGTKVSFPMLKEGERVYKQGVIDMIPKPENGQKPESILVVVKVSDEKFPFKKIEAKYLKLAD